MRRNKINFGNGLLTSRPDSGARMFIYFILLFAGIFLAISVYNLLQNAADAGSWGMMLLFGFIFAGVLLREKNIFPDLSDNKLVSYIASAFLLFIGIPILVSFITNLNIVVVILAALFIVPGALLILYTFANEKQWNAFKTTTKKKLHIKKKKGKKVRNFKR